MRSVLLIISLVLLLRPLPAQSIQIPSSINSYLQDEDNAVTEDRLLPFNNPKTAAFADFVLQNWRPLLANLNQVAPEPRQQCLIVASAEALPPGDYVQFVNELCDLNIKGTASSQAIWTVLWAGMNKDGFLAYNYDRPEVAAVIDKLQAIMLKENARQWAEFFKEMKSGQMKENVIQRKKRDGDAMPEEFVVSQIRQPNNASSANLQVKSNFAAASNSQDLDHIETISVVSSRMLWFCGLGGAILLVIGILVFNKSK